MVSCNVFACRAQMPSWPTKQLLSLIFKDSLPEQVDEEIQGEPANPH